MDLFDILLVKKLVGKINSGETDTPEMQEIIKQLKEKVSQDEMKTYVEETIAAIVANAPEDFDTLKEVADWISNDTLGTADLLQRMTTAEEKIVALDAQADWNQTDESAKDFILNKPIPITDDEIDAICGGDLTSENILVDIATGDVYKIYVENGKLSMEQVDATSDVTELMFIDDSTDVVYKAYVEDGKLCIMEVE